MLVTSLTCLSAHSAQLAIVIDDVGYSTQRDRKVFEFPVTVAIIPTAPHAKIRGEEAQAANREVLLHLPMLPFNGKNLEPDTLTPEMSEQEINRIIKQSLEVVPMAIGINNHMGSAMTADLAGMRRIFRALEDSKLIFLDSLTTGKSQAKQAAAEFNRHILTRDVFLDDTISEAAINEQFDQALRVARKNGYAIAIGHPHQATINVLSRRLAHLPDDIQLTRLSALSVQSRPIQAMPISKDEQTSTEFNQAVYLAKENEQVLEEQKPLIQQDRKSFAQTQPKAESNIANIQIIGNIPHLFVPAISPTEPIIEQPKLNFLSSVNTDSTRLVLPQESENQTAEQIQLDYSKLKIAIPKFLNKVFLSSSQSESNPIP